MTQLKTLTISAILAVLCAICVTSAHCQVPVVLAPELHQQFFDSSGRVLSFGCLFTYESGTTTPLATYTDYTGTVLNQNPLILTAGGFIGAGSSNMWIKAGQAYTIIGKSSGGTHCASGTTQFTINGVGGGLTVLTTVVPYSPTPSFPVASQNQLFEITLTGDAVAQPITAVGIIPPGWVAFQITQDSAGGHSFTWPANSVGGATIDPAANSVTSQFFYWDGSVLFAIGVGHWGNGPEISTGTIHDFGDLIISGSIVLTGGIAASHFDHSCTPLATTGVLRLCSGDAIRWRNNGNSGDIGISTDSGDRMVSTFGGGIEIVGTTPNLYMGGLTASFPLLKRNGTAVNVRLGDDSAAAALTALTLDVSGLYALGGPEVATPAAPTAANQKGYFKAGKGWCAEDSSSAEYCTAVNSGNGIAVQASSITTLGGTVSVNDSTLTTITTKSVTMPSSGCPCRAFVSYGVRWTNANSGVVDAYVGDGTNNFASSELGLPGSFNNGTGMTASSYSTGTYANGASVTFTLHMEQDTGATITVQNAPHIVGQGTYLNVAIFTSN